jgi:uncharacterized membrane protein
MNWLYPELKKVDPKDRISALHKAKEASFDTIEIVGIGIAVVVVVILTRYSAVGMGPLGRMGAALWNFVVAVPLLLFFAGPFYVRRVRRGLREYIERSSRSKGDQPQ